MTLYLLAVLANTFLFGFMGLTNEKTGAFATGHSHGLKRLITLAPILYLISFVVLLLSPGGLLRNIITVILLQVVVNHLIWGSINSALKKRA